jgi:tetratricopeptide (TPR) repeat protein
VKPRIHIRKELSRAELCLGSGDAAGACDVVRAILRADPEHIGAQEVLARAEWQLARYRELLATLSVLIRLNPYEPGYHALAGSAYQALGAVANAIRCFARAENSPTAGAAIEELRSWQETLVAELLREDPSFQIAYARDPANACRERGFDFAESLAPQKSWFATAEAQSFLYSRPS